MAQLNLARALYDLDDPRMADFMSQLDAINALAEAAPGFVWRLKTESGNATDINLEGDERVVVNMSVWQSIDTLFDYTYTTAHTAVMKRRRAWFEKHDRPGLVLWRVEDRHIPTLDEALARLKHLRTHGPGPEAFTFKERF